MSIFTFSSPANKHNWLKEQNAHHPPLEEQEPQHNHNFTSSMQLDYLFHINNAAQLSISALKFQIQA
jgi:hypothetical protein